MTRRGCRTAAWLSSSGSSLSGAGSRYDRVKRPDERVLAVWLARQRTCLGKDRLRADRRERLSGVLPGWMS